MDSSKSIGQILIIEPFYGGSHKKLIEVIASGLNEDQYTLITMSPKKWHWRARTSALYISTQIPQRNYTSLFCTSVLPLTELLGLCPDLAGLHKVVYFHENQLEFPVRVTKERDYQYGYNEILSCLAADKVLFNSKYNLESFLSNIQTHIKLQPDYRVKGLAEAIKGKSSVIYYPIDINMIDSLVPDGEWHKTGNILHIVWAHRWEFDKNPDSFYKVLCRMIENDISFKVSILGESFSEKPEEFSKVLSKLQGRLLHCSYIENQTDYYRILKQADVIVSTAIHEFFGVSVMEAVYCGCIPVVPKRLAYRELYEEVVQEMYETDDQLYDVLAKLATDKCRGFLNKLYRHVALNYDSNVWIKNFINVMSFESQ